MKTDEPLRARLIETQTVKQVLTGTCVVDTHTALVRGLADYVRELSLDFNGALYRFQTVHEDYPDQEEDATYPSALVAEADGDGAEYAMAPLTPDDEGYELGDGTNLHLVSSLSLTVKVECTATTREERIGITKMLEDAANPVTWMGGFRLVLPAYHGVHADYSFRGLSYADAQDDVTRNYRRVVALFAAECPQVRAFKTAPRMRLGLGTTVDDVRG